MRTWTLGPTFATLLLGVGVGAQAHAQEAPACKGKCGGGAPDQGQGRAGARILSSSARSGVFELPSQEAAETPAPNAAAAAAPPAPRTPQYETAGLVSGEELGGDGEAAELVEGDDLVRSGEANAVNQRRGALFGRTLRVPVSTAYAAPLTASDDTCMGSRTIGVQAMGFGLSVATTWEDRQCRRLNNARELFALGYRAAAVQLLCMDDEVYAAMERAGTPCPGVRVTRTEIAAPVEPAPAPPLITFDDVLFDFDRATLRPDAHRILDPLLAMLRADPNMSIDIEGHTDWVGSDAYNQALSERRARAVADWLVAHGIARERLTAIGRGESDPVGNNRTADGRQLNRRVEIRRL